MELEISIFENKKWNFYLYKSWKNSLMIICSSYPNPYVYTNFKNFSDPEKSNEFSLVKFLKKLFLFNGWLTQTFH